MEKQSEQTLATRPQHHMGMKAKNAIGNTIIYIILVIMSIIWLFPFICIVLESFRGDINEAGARVTWQSGNVIPTIWTFQNYIDLFTETKFLNWFGNTLLISVISAVINTFMVICMSYTLSRLRFKGRKALMNAMLVLGMFPGMLTMIILYRVLADLHLTGTYGNAVWGLILVYTASSGMGYYVSKGFFDTLPKSLDEAARIDGCTNAQVLFKVIIPLSKPIVVYTLLTAFMGPWGDYVFAAYISGASDLQKNVAVGLQYLIGTPTNLTRYYTTFCAGGVVVAVPITVLFMFLQKYYVEGVTGGAVKG